jgi:uncharacterized protein YjbI with pentapeptide repeats/superfamily II DNA or RNA helicase
MLEQLEQNNLKRKAEHTPTFFKKIRNDSVQPIPQLQTNTGVEKTPIWVINANDLQAQESYDFCTVTAPDCLVIRGNIPSRVSLCCHAPLTVEGNVHDRVKIINKHSTITVLGDVALGSLLQADSISVTGIPAQATFCAQDIHLEQLPLSSVEQHSTDGTLKQYQIQLKALRITIKPIGTLAPLTLPPLLPFKFKEGLTYLHSMLQDLHQKCQLGQAPQLKNGKTLRPFQLRGITEFCNALMQSQTGREDAVFEYCTGSGKTLVFTTIGQRLMKSPDMKMLVIVPQTNLISQIKDSIHTNASKLTVARYRKDKNWKRAKVVLITPQAMVKDLQRKPELREFPLTEYSIAVLDEAHHIQAPKYKAIPEALAQANVSILAFTATPESPDNDPNKSLYHFFGFKTPGQQACSSDLKQNPITPFPIMDAFEQHALCESLNVGSVRVELLPQEHALLERDLTHNLDLPDEKLDIYLNKPEYNRIAVDIYANGKHPDNNTPFFGEKAILFCAGIKHAQALANEFNQQLRVEEHPELHARREQYVRRIGGQAAYQAFKVAAALHSHLPEKEQESILRQYKEGGILVLTGAEKLVEGFDCESASLEINLRCSGSRRFKKQCLGRITRSDPSNPHKKAHAIAFDYRLRNQLLFSDVLNGQYQLGRTTPPVSSPAPSIPIVLAGNIAPHSPINWKPSDIIGLRRPPQRVRKTAQIQDENQAKEETGLLDTALKLTQTLDLFEEVLSQFNAEVSKQLPYIQKMSPVVIPAKQTSLRKPAQVPSKEKITENSTFSVQLSGDLTQQLKHLEQQGHKVNEQVANILEMILPDEDRNPTLTTRASKQKQTTDHLHRYPAMKQVVAQLNGFRVKLDALTKAIQHKYSANDTPITIRDEMREDLQELQENIGFQLQEVLADLGTLQKEWNESNVKHLVELVVQQRQNTQPDNKIDADAMAAELEQLLTSEEAHNSIPQAEPVDEDLLKELLFSQQEANDQVPTTQDLASYLQCFPDNEKLDFIKQLPVQNLHTLLSTEEQIETFRYSLIEDYFKDFMAYLNNIHQENTNNTHDLELFKQYLGYIRLVHIDYKEGITIWSLNKYTKQPVNLSNIDLRPYLAQVTGCHLNFTGSNFAGANLSGLNLTNICFDNANLSGADLNSTHIENTSLSGADLQNANLANAKLINTDLTHANLQKVNLNSSQLIGVNLQNACLKSAILDSSLIDSSNLAGTVLQDINLRNAIIRTCLTKEQWQELNALPPHIPTKRATNLALFLNYQAHMTQKANLNFGQVYRVISLNKFAKKKVNLSTLDLRPFQNRIPLNLDGSNLSGANLSGLDIASWTFNKTDLSHANLSHTNLSGTKLTNANLEGTNFAQANLPGIDLDGSNLKSTLFTRAVLSGAKLTNANLEGTNFTQASLPYIDLRGSNLKSTLFIRAVLHHADLSHTTIIDSDFTEANLEQAKFTFTKINGGQFFNANLKTTNLDYTSFNGINLAKANLQNCTLICASLQSINLQNVQLDGATINHTKICYSNLAGVSLLNLRSQYSSISQSITIGINPSLQQFTLFTNDNETTIDHLIWLLKITLKANKFQKELKYACISFIKSLLSGSFFVPNNDKPIEIDIKTHDELCSLLTQLEHLKNDEQPRTHMPFWFHPTTIFKTPQAMPAIQPSRQDPARSQSNGMNNPLINPAKFY